MTTKTLTQFRTRVDYWLDSDSDIISQNARDALIEDALSRYSRDCPDDYTEDVTGDGGRYYDLASSLTNWSEGFSYVLEIQYPAPTIASDETVTLLDPEDYDDDYWLDGTRYLYLPNHAPSSSEALRIRYTTPYVFDGSNEVDIPEQDFGAVARLAAGFVCQAMANKFSRQSDSTIAIDAVNHRSKADEYRRRAQEMLEYYQQHVGLLQDQEERAASGFVDLDAQPGWPHGRNFIFKNRYIR